MNIDLAKSFLDHFSVITIGDNKVPNFPWKKQQSEKLNIDEFTKNFNYKGGIFKKDGSEITETVGVGIVTGFEYLEVIDIDTKVFSTQLEMDEFWNEFYQTLKDTIINFDEKFVIYKTKTGGYHILYKSKRVQGNTKIASLKGHKEAIIETRGVGGYVFIYPKNKVSEKTYFEIEFITDEDRDALWRICKSYNYIEEQPKIDVKIQKEYENEGVTPWEDFNNKTDIWDVICDDFTIPTNGQKKNHYLIKRHGSTSEHSGYVFRDSGCMFLFSTGTQYPAEKLISSYAAFTYKFHNGDFSASAKDLYEQGFGERIKSKIKESKPLMLEKPIIKNVEFPLEIFNKDIEYYIRECSEKLDSNIDYMGCSLIWLISVCVGNTFNIEVKKGWVENGVVWISIVGKAGIGKTPSINNIIFPLLQENNKEIKRFISESDKYNYYQKLDKEEKKLHSEPKEPRKTQFIANDITLEALVELHQENDNAVGVFKDELAGWLKDMNKYRAGSDLEFWLSTWSGKAVNMNRKTAKSSFVEKPFIPVLGGIQPNIFDNFSTEENKDNGFLDRMLMSFPDSEVEYYNENELDEDLINWYKETIRCFYRGVKTKTTYNNLDEIEPIKCKFTPDAKKEWVRIFNDITNNQNDDNENEYLKSMYPKQKSYIPRFALLLHLFNTMFDDEGMNYNISKQSILQAEKLSKYFVNTAKKIKIESTETNNLKKLAIKEENPQDKLKSIWKADKDFNRSKVADMLGVSRQTVINWTKKLEETK